MNRRLATLLVLVGVAGCNIDRDTPTEVGQTTRDNSVNSPTPAQDRLFTLVAAPPLTAQQRALLQTITNRPTTAEVHVAILRNDAGLVLGSGRNVVVDVSPSVRFMATTERVSQNRDGTLSWQGHIPVGFAGVQFVLTTKGITGTLHVGSTLYHFEPIGGGLHALVRRGSFPLDDPLEDPSDAPMEPDESSPASPFRSPSMAASSATARIDVLVVYTQAVANAVADVEALIQLAVEETNTAYANSAIVLTVSKVHSAQVNYAEGGRTYAQHVAALQSTNDGIMDDVHALRNQYPADMVVLLVSDFDDVPSLCGRASTIYADAGSAFAVVRYDCATGRYTFGHEIGHLQGARHEWPTDNTWSYRHGYVDPNDQWRTIMATGVECGDCTRVQYFSNPDVTYPPTGQPMGNATLADVARVFEETKFTMANFRKWITASLSGPTNTGHYDTCQWTATVSNGTPPYSYSWSAYWESSSTGYFFNSPGAANTTAWGYYYGSYPNPTTVNVYVSGSDAAGEFYSLQRTVNLHNYALGCY